MFHINIHCKPKKENLEHYGKIIGAYAVILIDYKDYDGAMELAKFYVIENDWEIIEIEEEYFTFDSKDDLGDDYQEYYDEVKEYGYSMVFNMYNEIEED
jgi:ribosome biogenesis protein Nip4